MTNNAYTSSKSFGVKEYCRQSINVGTSSKNSFHFADVEITCRDFGDHIQYQLIVDDVRVISAKLDKKTKELVYDE